MSRPEASTEFIATWALGMIGVALDCGISERIIKRVLHPKILPKLIEIAKQQTPPVCATQPLALSEPRDKEM